MKVNFYSTLRDLAGVKTVEMHAAAGATAWEILEGVTHDNAELTQEIWRRPGELRDHIKVLINGRLAIFLPEGLETRLADDAVLDVFPPVGGG